MSFLLSRKPSSQKNNYVCRGTLRGHSGPVLSLAATDDGKLLASGAADGTRVWDLQTMQEMCGPSSGGVMGATTSMGAPDFEEFFCGQLTKPGEVTGLAFDPLSNRLAVCNRNGIVQVHSVDGSMNLRELFLKEIPNSSPQAVAFGAMCGTEKDVLVFNLHSGHIHILRRGEIVGRWNVGAFIGDACIDAGKGSMCLADPIYGVSVHRLEDNGLLKVNSFKIPVTKKTRVRKVAFANQCREVVGGSDHGLIYVFDRKKGHTIDELRIDPGEWAQTVTATECNGAPTILAAKSICDDAAPNEI
ncbi:hypothetical protein MVEN_02215200 [Mycena venus]|uniref:WD40 repeat-like protein n=1 Tax=Mycena venus TaxID=2733690 RepID=A0A8H7CGL5_9AGAR|nr:hypothetical protein MVEN_02215200 [Mycena venus]